MPTFPRTVADAVRTWLDLHSRCWTSPRSCLAPTAMAREWIKVIGTLSLDSVQPLDVQRLFLEADNGHRSAAWLNKERDRLHGFFAWAIELDLCRSNPVTRSAWPRKPACQGSSRSRTHVRVTAAILERILDLAPIRYHRLLVFLFLAGLRIGEALAARWRWVVRDPRDPELWILAVPARSEQQEERKQSVGYLVPLGARALAILGSRGSDDDRLFAEAPGKSAIWQMLHRIGERLGIRGLSAHQFRRSCSTVLVDEGMPLPAAVQFMGWRCAPKAWLDDLSGSYYLGLEGARARAIQDRLWPDRS